MSWRNSFFSRSVFCLLAMTVTLNTVSAGDLWPEWRGPGGQGVSDAKNLPVSWSETENIQWKVKVPGKGWSTPVIEGGRVWVTLGIDKTANKEDYARRRKASKNKLPLIISESVNLRTACFDLATGEQLHDIELLTEQNPQEIHVDNTYASPSPAFQDGKLFCHFGPYGSACVDTASGKKLWENRNLRVDHQNGAGSSPILWEDLLIVHCDGIDKQYIVALDKSTGEEVWKTIRSGKLRENEQLQKSYATALIVEVAGKAQVVSPSADWIYGYDARTGRELWKLPYGVLGFSNAARPVAGNGLIYSCTGYMKSELMAIKVGGNGDASQAKEVWRFKKQVPNVSSTVLVGTELYFASDNGIATCLNAVSGESIWTSRVGKRFWASPIAADGRLYFLDRDGETAVIKQGKTFQKLAINKLDGTQLSSPAAVDGRLVIRTDSHLYSIGE